MKRQPLTAIILLCFFLPSTAQKPAGKDKSQPPAGMDEARYEENRLSVHIADISLNAAVNEKDDYKSGLLQVELQLNRRPAVPLKVLIMLKSGDTSQAQRPIPGQKIIAN